MKNVEIFQKALEPLEGVDNGISDPKSFQDYAGELGITSINTAQHISVDSYDQLNGLLKNHHSMVLRLGKPPGERYTHFALIKVKDHLKDFFFFDETIFSNKTIETFFPITNVRKFFQFLILPDLTESSFVNLGLASGLVGTALNLDNPETMIIPATTQSTFTFQFRPHSFFDTILTHYPGQIEIDSIFIEKRNGKDVLFVIEAKSNHFTSLSKHKLIYPYLAIKDKIPQDIDIVPVYIKVRKVKTGYTYDIAECRITTDRDDIVAMDQIEVTRSLRLNLPVKFGK